MQLSSAHFEKAVDFIRTKARPLDQALFAFHFESGSVDAVLQKLIHFQNEDGGFGQGMEPDAEYQGSSPLATTVGLQIMQSFSLPTTHPIIQQAMAYLCQSFNAQKGYWQPMPVTVNDVPHAPWWTYDLDTDKTAPESPANPTAEIMGYLHAYPDQVSDQLRDQVTSSTIDFLVTHQADIEMHETYCYQRSLPHLPSHLQDQVLPILNAIINRCVETDPSAWSGYVAQPLDFVSSPDSPWYHDLADAVEANLDHVIQAQADDGSWPPTWSWGDQYPDAWTVAKQAWAGHRTVNILKTLQRFGRLPE
ncbi:MAG: hypothetical protein AAF629_12440 [Chloroflexota bacterium]